MTDARRKPITCDCGECTRPTDSFYVMLAAISLIVSAGVVFLALLFGLFG